MQKNGVWIAFLVMCFALTGMVGLFASYSTSIPLERAMHRLTLLDRPGPAETNLRDAMGKDADPILALPADDRLARARTAIMDEGQTEARTVAIRTRWMIGLVTAIAAALGAGLLLLAGRP